MRTTKTYRNVTAKTPNFELIKNYFDKFATTLNCQSMTHNKCIIDDTVGTLLRFFETTFTTFSEGSIIVRYYIDTKKYTAIFENEYVRLRAYFATSSKGGNTVRLYDGENYYGLGEDYLRDKSHLDNIINFIDGLMYSEGESEFEDNLYFKTKI